MQSSTVVTLFDFLKMNGDSVHTLAEITPVSVDGTAFNNQNFMIIPVGLYAGGSPDLLLDNEWLATDETLNAIPGFSEFIEENADFDTGFCYYNGGWYLTRDFEHKYECSHFPVEEGTGFIVAVGGTQEAGVKLTYSGEVAAADLPVVVPQSATVSVGNFAPVARTLADFIPVSVDGTAFNNQNFMIIPVGLYAGGSPDLLLDNEWLASDETLNDIPGFSEFIEENADFDTGFCYYNGGWYLTRDFEHKYMCSHFPVPAGEGFIMAVGGTQEAGVQLTLPHAFK